MQCAHSRSCVFGSLASATYRRAARAASAARAARAARAAHAARSTRAARPSISRLALFHARARNFFLSAHTRSHSYYALEWTSVDEHELLHSSLLISNYLFANAIDDQHARRCALASAVSTAQDYLTWHDQIRRESRYIQLCFTVNRDCFCKSMKT